MSTTTSRADLIRRCLAAWEASDAGALDALLADDFTFTSPNDDHLNRAQYWEVCWPGSKMIRRIHVLNVMADGDEAFVRYEAELTDGKRFKNTEYFRFDGDRIATVEVYFGRTIAEADGG
jgi:ketosteroid isomerase-like protein